MNAATVSGSARTWNAATRAALRAEIVTVLAPIPGYHAALLADPLTDAIEAVIATPYVTGGTVSTGALQHAIDSACDPTPFAAEKVQAPLAKMVALFTAEVTAHDDTEPDRSGSAGSASAPAATAAANDVDYVDALVGLVMTEGADALVAPDADAKIEATLSAPRTEAVPSDVPVARVLRQDLDDRTGATTLHDSVTGTSVGPLLDDETIKDVLARPEVYFGSPGQTPDRDGFLVELWIDTSGWNEGHDTVCAPVLVAYVATAHDADDVMTAISTVPHTYAWTGFEARMRVAPSTARQRSVERVVAEWATWINGPGPASLVP